MERVWTPEQKKVIDLRERNLLVSAAAGSGKTAVLVERIIEMISSDKNPCNIDELLVVTFTNAAASEMRERISAGLLERINAQPDNEHLQKQQTLLHSAMICTIDSFCLNVVRNHFNRINLDPSFKLGDEVEMELLRGEVLGELLEKEYERCGQDDGNQNDFLDFAEMYGGAKSDSKIEDIILAAAHIAESCPKPFEWIKEQERTYAPSNIEAMLNEKWTLEIIEETHKNIENLILKAEAALKICNESDGPLGYCKTIESDISMLESFRGLTDYSALNSHFNEVKPAKLAGKNTGANEDKKLIVKMIRDTVKKEFVNLRDNFYFQSPDEMFADICMTEKPMKVMLGLAADFLKAYAQRKEERNKLDFNDVEHMALDILTDYDKGIFKPSEIAESMSRQYAEIMIDEYQDSNLVQEIILNSVSRERIGSPNVFMVGDVKQSIYKFRLAMPELFMEKYNTYSDEDSSYQKIDLHKNFRSRPEVLCLANYIFEWCMKKKICGIEYDKAAALYAGRDTAAVVYEPEVLIIQPGEYSDGTCEEEAKAVARRIHELVDSENGVMIEENGLERPAEYGDITILLRTMRGWAETFTDVLMSDGIPAFSDTRAGFFQTQEIKAVINYLRLLANPQQDIPAVAVFLSPIVRLQADDMAEIRQYDLSLFNSARIYAEKGKKENLRTKLCNFFGIYDELRRHVPHTMLHNLIRELYTKTGFINYASAMPAGDRRKANLEMLLERAMMFEATGLNGLFNFIAYIERLLEYNIDYGEALPDESAAKAVRIMSIHRSKGLEFPIVILAGTGRKFNQMDAAKNICLHSELGIGADCIDLEKRTKVPTLRKRIMQQRMVHDNLNEELRILYVALTRARERTIITGSLKKPDDSIRKWCNMASYISEYDDERPDSFLDYIGAALFRKIPYSDIKPQSDADTEEINWCDTNITITIRDSFDNAAADVRFRVIDNGVGEEKVAEVQEYDTGKKRLECIFELAAEGKFDNDVYKELRQRAEYHYPHEAAVGLPIKMSVSELKHRAMELNEEFSESKHLIKEDTITIPRFLRDDKKSETIITGSDKGTLYHRVMQNLAFGQVHNEEEMKSFLGRLREAGRLEQNEEDALEIEKFLCFLNSSVAKRMEAAEVHGKLYREQPFVLGTDMEGETVLIQGIIDVFFEEDGEIVLLDYKTDVVGSNGEEILINRYRTQLDYYRQAIEQITGKKVKESLIYSFSLNKTICIPI